MTLSYHDEIEIDASADDVWAVYSDVEHWADWTASVAEVRFVDGDHVAMGARVHIRQPKLRPGVWTVTAVEPARSWTWHTRLPGMHTTGIHTVEPLGTHGARVHQTIEHRGPLGAIFGRLYGRLTRSYLAMEANGLKQRCEAHART
ncbi:MAG TPA: SRPBCC family protein [Acidimicrobiia bacterium]